MQRYEGEPIPRPAPDASDDLVALAPGPAGQGTGALDIPIPSLPVSRPAMRYPLTLPGQDLGIGVEVHQAGAGRPLIPARVLFPVQNPTPIPDGRRIGRPMPVGAVDADQVIPT